MTLKEIKKEVEKCKKEFKNWPLVLKRYEIILALAEAVEQQGKRLEALEKRELQLLRMLDDFYPEAKKPKKAKNEWGAGSEQTPQSLKSLAKIFPENITAINAVKVKNKKKARRK